MARRDLLSLGLFGTHLSDLGEEALHRHVRGELHRAAAVPGDHLRECVNYALRDPNIWGIWGASTDEQRRDRRRQLRQAG